MFLADWHHSCEGGVTLQADGQCGVSIRADARDTEVSVVVCQGEELAVT